MNENNQVMALLAPTQPFGNAPPRLVRVELYTYRYSAYGQPEWWRRTLEREYLVPLSLGRELDQYRQARGWTTARPPPPSPSILEQGLRAVRAAWVAVAASTNVSAPALAATVLAVLHVPAVLTRA
jgi:hypothetical protein